jgi:hypothetical protein
MNVLAGYIIEELRKAVAKFDTQAQAAKSFRVTPSVLSLTLSGQVNVIPEKILTKLGYVAQIAYFKKRDAKRASSAPPAAKKVEKKPRAAFVKATQKAAPKKTVRQKRAPEATPPTGILVSPDAPVERNTQPDSGALNISITG